MASTYERGPGPVSVDERVAALAVAQHGIFRRDQAVALGASDGLIHHRITSGRWERLSPGVYLIAGSPPTWRRSLLTSCFAWGPGAVVSHSSAGALWRFPGFEPFPIQITVPRRRDRARPGVVHRPRLLSPVDVTVVDRIPVTTPARTFIDLAAVAPSDVVEIALDDALRRQLVSLARMRWRLQETGSRGRAGTRALQAFIEARAGTHSVPQSVLETRFLRCIRDAGLPVPVVQHPVRRGGSVVAIVDFAYPDQRLAVETDGHRFHSGRADFDHDRARRNELTLLGWRVIHVTWTDLVEQPDTIVKAITTALSPEPLD